MNWVRAVVWTARLAAAGRVVETLRNIVVVVEYGVLVCGDLC